ncbi:MAG: hypothetical protein LBQ58_10395 [Synergistaceae bacterium]|jgi:hypothetical protein|nr:hypothetical protein [Synergistaceae bacterium]
MKSFCLVWKSHLFENIDTPSVEASALHDSWRVKVKAPDLAWGYCFEFPGEARSGILWQTSLDVLDESGDISPGIALHDFSQGMLLQVNRAHGTAELRLVDVNKRTTSVGRFSLPGVALPYRVALKYNAVTTLCIGSVNNCEVFALNMPYRGIPAILSAAAVEIVTTTPPLAADEGTVIYGDLLLNSE